MSSSWSGRRVGQARAIVATRLPAPCGQCGRTIEAGANPRTWVVGHIKARATHPHLIWEPSNWRPEHRRCSNRTGHSVAIANAELRGARAAMRGDFSDDDDAGSHRFRSSLPPGSDGQWSVSPRLRWAHHVASAPDWLAPYLVVPENASPPLAMTEVHPLAVCSYGAATCQHGWRGVPFVVDPPAIEWIERERKITLRWWQRLAVVRQLEHDAVGRLVWPRVIESGTRRIGKSERLRSVALWRMERGVELFEPGQLVMHFGRDLGVVREVQERAWNWCRARGWSVATGNGKEVVTHPNGARWLAKTSAYTFDVHLGLVDECWDVEPGRISEDLEPATLERVSPQVVLTSTSHRLATSLMKRRISAALANDDGRTLLLLWAMEPAADIFAESTWRAASAHWTVERRDQMAAELAEAQEKAAAPDVDDPDPVGSWCNQYLNRWDLVVRPRTRGELVVDADAWAGLVEDRPAGAPRAAAIESWFGEGLSVALAWRLEDGAALVAVAAFEDLVTAVSAVKASRFRGVTTVGASLVGDPALEKFRHRPGQGRTADAVKDLERLLREDVMAHDGGEHLTGQVLALRTVPGVDGQRVSSTGRADAVKAAVWAVGSARASKGKPRFVLPTS